LDAKDIVMIENLIGENEELRKLYQNHLGFETRLAELHKRSYLSDQNQLEIKEIKKKKLQGKDRIEQILSEYRQ
jgi:uncharacterized protein